MLEEKNDNLLEADGNLENNSVETTNDETTVLEEIQTVGIVGSIEDSVGTNTETALTEAQVVIENENQTELVTETHVDEENRIAIDSDETIAEDNKLSETDLIIDAIADNNAEESEDETLKERHDIPMLDYDALTLESLVAELKNLVTNEKVMSVKDHVEEIKKSFLAKY